MTKFHMFSHYNHLGSRSYFCLDDSSEICFQNIDEAIAQTNENIRHIDPVAVLGVMMKNYPIADRTMINGIKKSPWMAKPNGSGGWSYATVPPHGKLFASANDIAVKLKIELLKEAMAFLDGKKTVGILLSGGMDSRIVAGIIRQLQVDGDYNGNVIVLSWGLPNSRDVIYSQRIASRFAWDHIHYPINTETLRSNIYLAADRGAEFSPVHLHAMAAVSKTTGLDGILAGSYGDSIGRAEYSRIKVKNLYHITSRHFNHLGLMNREVESDSLEIMKLDLASYRKKHPRNEEWQYRELEMQAHYMRRMLNPCMSVIDDKIPIYQMFTSPDVFGYMWSLDTKCRTDDPYFELLKLLPGNLLDIPWARTGRLYGANEPIQQDNYTSYYQNYGKWLRQDCADLVKSSIESGVLQSLGVFNNVTLDMWKAKWINSQKLKADRLDERMAWLVSLSLFVKKYNVSGYGGDRKITFFDYLNTAKGFAYVFLYRGLKRLNKYG